MTSQAQVADGQPAIEGGQPVRPQGGVVRRLFGPEEKEAVGRLFDLAIEKGSHLLGYNGEQEEAFCREFAEALGGGYADALNSGTNAVFAALRALELEPGSEVIVSPVSDPGGVMPVALCNLIPVPADASENFYNTDAAQIRERITPRTRAVLVTHISGRPVDMEPVMELARERGLFVIEDCAQAHGTEIFCTRSPQLFERCLAEGAERCLGRRAGSFGDLAIFSTMFSKQMATGGQGGLVFTRSEELYWKVRRHADRGKPFGITLGGGAGSGVGGASARAANMVAALNHNMDELSACLGRVQLRRLPGFIARRRQVAAQIEEHCRRLAGIRLVGDPPWGRCSYWHLFFEFESSAYRVSKERFAQGITAEGIPAVESYGYYPCRMAWARGNHVYGTASAPWCGIEGVRHPADWPIPNAEAVDSRHFFIPINESWTDADAGDLAAILDKLDAAWRR